ncbi:MAG: glutathione S-transferase family protein [Bradyrhizobiaceae bacterium]|nr:MAG: glutathione S-transferase family protein [Bradyrhizobiaceae bacterium]
MARQLFELAGRDPAHVFSPYCWRARMALAHKGLDHETIPWRFMQKDAIKPHNSEKVPVLVDGDVSVCDSWAIANYLEDKYPERPSLFGGEGGRAMARMINSWSDVSVGQIAPLIIADIHAGLDPGDQDYFRRTREKNLGRKLEEAIADREQRVEDLRRWLHPLRMTLRAQPYFGGTSPNYADYIIFGPFQWARLTSTFELLATDDPIYGWREKLLDMFGGMARNSPAVAAA